MWNRSPGSCRSELGSACSDFDRQVTLRGNVRHTRYASATQISGLAGRVQAAAICAYHCRCRLFYQAAADADAGVGLRFTKFKLQLLQRTSIRCSFPKVRV